MEEDTGGGLVCALPTSPPPLRGSFSRVPAAGGGGRRRAAAGAAAPAVRGWEGWQVGREL